MATSLYDLSVPTFLQTVKAVGGFLDRAVTYCSETRADPDDFVHARLFDDMAPFHFQIEAAWHHSVWGLEAVKTGVFAPPALGGPVPFANLQAMIGQAARQDVNVGTCRIGSGPFVLGSYKARRVTHAEDNRRRHGFHGWRHAITGSLPMTPTITAFERSPDRGKGLARDMRVRWALEEVGQL